VQVLQVQLEVGPDPAEVGRARRWARSRLVGSGIEDDEPLAETLILLISELVTNAVVHARSTVTVDLAVTDDGPVLVRVHDESPVRPIARRHHADRPGGRGLHLLESLAARWGVEQTGTGKSIWFEVDRLQPG
jgi:anti-sigma regulatory factor (Ser/Thr protein kinase)